MLKLRSQTSLWGTFPGFFFFQNYLLDLLNHAHIWQASPQLSCGDTCQTRPWYQTRGQRFDHHGKSRKSTNGAEQFSIPPSHSMIQYWLNWLLKHDDVITWRFFPHYWPFVRGITGDRWLPSQRASNASNSWTSFWANSPLDDGLICHGGNVTSLWWSGPSCMLPLTVRLFQGSTLGSSPKRRKSGLWNSLTDRFLTRWPGARNRLVVGAKGCPDH